MSVNAGVILENYSTNPREGDRCSVQHAGLKTPTTQNSARAAANHFRKGGAADNSVSAGAPGAMPMGVMQKRGHKPPMPAIVGGIVAAVAVIAVAVFVLIPKGPEVRDCLNDYSWDEISQISQLISKKGDQNGAIEVAKKYHLCTSDGKLDGTQTKDVTLSGGTQAKVMIMGFNHDDKSDGSGKAGITFIFTDEVAKQNMCEKSDMDSLFQKIQDNGSATLSWEDTSLHAWLTDSFTSQLPSELSDKIVAVNKTDAVMPLTTFTARSYSGGNVEEIPSAEIDYDSNPKAVTSSDKLWLPSYVEIASPDDTDELEDIGFPSHPLQEGSQYQLFRDAGVKEVEPNKILGTYSSEEGGGWWLRTVGIYEPARWSTLDPCFLAIYSHGDGKAACYRNDGQPYSYNKDGDPIVGVRPAFCI